MQLECAKFLHETLVVPVLMYGSDTLLCKEKERYRIRAVQMDNLRGLLGIRWMDRVPNVRIKELCVVTKGVDERIDEGALQEFGHFTLAHFHCILRADSAVAGEGND